MFRRNPALRSQLEGSADYKAGITRMAHEVKRNVEVIAPRGSTGNYADSIEVDGSRVLTTDFAGHLVEFGSKNNPPYAPLRRGVQAAGLKLEEK